MNTKKLVFGVLLLLIIGTVLAVIYKQSVDSDVIRSNIKIGDKEYDQKNLKRVEHVLEEQNIDFSTKKTNNRKYEVRVDESVYPQATLALSDNGLVKGKTKVVESSIKNKFQRRRAQQIKKIETIRQDLESEFKINIRKMYCPKFYSDLKQCVIKIWGDPLSKNKTKEVSKFVSQKMPMSVENIHLKFTQIEEKSNIEKLKEKSGQEEIDTNYFKNQRNRQFNSSDTEE